MRLAVGDLRDDDTSWDLGLAIRDLGNGWLRDSGYSGWDLRLAVTDLAWNRKSSTVLSNQIDGGALLGPMTVIKVIERTTPALVEDSRASKSESVVGAYRESTGIDSACLRRRIELELEVACDITVTTSLILQHTVVQ